MDFQNLRLSTMSPGTYTIKAIFDGDDDYNAAETEFTLVVSEHPEGTQYTVQNPDPIDNSNGTLSFSQPEVEYTKRDNNTYKLQQPNNPRFINYTWSSSGGTIDLTTGTFSATEAGTYTLTVTADNGATASYTITIEEEDDSWIETDPEPDPDPNPDPDPQQEEDQDKFFLYFDRQLVYQQQNSGNVYNLQSPKWSLSPNGTVPQSILSNCYYTIDNDPTPIPVSNTQIAIANEGHHIIYLHFTGNNEYEAHNIAYTLAVYSELESDREKLNLRFTNNYVTLEMGTNESILSFRMDANYSDVDANDFTVTVTESGSQTTQATATLSLISHQVTVTGMEDGKSYNVQLHYDGSSKYSEATTTCTVAITGEGQEPIIDYANEYLTIESLEDGNEVSFGKFGRSVTGQYDYQPPYLQPVTVYYSLDKVNWTLNQNQKITLNRNQKIYFKGSNEYYCSWDDSYRLQYEQYGPICTKSAKAYGNIMSLYVGDNFKTTTVVPHDLINHRRPHTGDYWGYKAFGYMFNYIYGDNKTIDTTNVVMPTIETRYMYD